MIRENAFEPIYTDIHIHTTENPDNIQKGIKYDFDSLIKGIDKISKKQKKLISFTDHNTINKSVYLHSFPELYYLILGVELHISYDASKKPYHCHMFFNVDINEENIDKINFKLDKLYSKKQITNADYDIVPKLEDIINQFYNYDFLLLPHGGQSHCTFDKAISDGMQFDDVMEKMLYYNQFDGFTSRSTTGKDKTTNYFKRIGIDEFTNLITCSDNYNPQKYPDAKGKTKESFIPTCILAEPTFQGLRMSLSESSRLIYSNSVPDLYEEYIQKYEIHNDLLDIDVNFQPGLNVIIGESSSGKSLLIDSLVKAINPKLGKSIYSDYYNFENLNIKNPAGFVPYYIDQNYIIEVSNNNKIEDIPLIKQLFGPTADTEKKTTEQLNKLDSLLSNLINTVEQIEQYQNKLNALTNLNQVILFKHNKKTPLDNLFPKELIIDKLDYDDDTYEKHIGNLDEILKFSKNNINVPNIDMEIKLIKEKLKLGYDKSQFETYIRTILKKNKQIYNNNYKYTDEEIKLKTQNYENALLYISQYIQELNTFNSILNKISKFSYKVTSKPLHIGDYTLFVENNLKISKNTIVENINEFLKVNNKIESFENIIPSDLFLDKFNGKYKLESYKQLEEKIYLKFKEINKYSYKIETINQKKWEELSPGWKTAILTELILQYDKDQAPLIIDQPEDNLANKYINTKLIKDIKKSKRKKQIIFVSHNPSIPILADAENIIFCKAGGKKIKIRSNYMENKIENRYCLDLIAEITDGGKQSIKKRFKKYNIKTYKEAKDEI